jgi:hypothetical protein
MCFLFSRRRCTLDVDKLWTPRTSGHPSHSEQGFRQLASLLITPEHLTASMLFEHCPSLFPVQILLVPCLFTSGARRGRSHVGIFQILFRDWPLVFVDYIWAVPFRAMLLLPHVTFVEVVARINSWVSC